MTVRDTKKGIMNRGKKICLSPSNGLINQPMNNNTQTISKVQLSFWRLFISFFFFFLLLKLNFFCRHTCANEIKQQSYMLTSMNNSKTPMRRKKEGGTKSKRLVLSEERKRRRLSSPKSRMLRENWIFFCMEIKKTWTCVRKKWSTTFFFVG